MNNIDCDQIILFGLVAIFAIYVYRNVLDPSQQGFMTGSQNTQNFRVGGQNPPNNANVNANANNNTGVNNATNGMIAEINNRLNNMNNQNSGINQQIQQALGNMNNAANRAENSANAARAAANNAANTVSGATAALNANGAPLANTQANVSGNDNSNSGPAPFNVPEPNANPGGDSIPRSYNVSGENKTDSCFPQDTLTAEDLLPQEDLDAIKQFSEESIGDGVLKGIELLGAGYHVGVNSVGQSLRNANQQLRSEPPNPQTEVSPWMNSTIGPDLQRRPLELTESCAKATGENTADVPGNTQTNDNLSNTNFDTNLTGNSNANREPVAANSR
tara:strand:+ start:42 stop:1040 length:999 start_codon:yes stop_codon:yes gene_type:complete